MASMRQRRKKLIGCAEFQRLAALRASQMEQEACRRLYITSCVAEEELGTFSQSRSAILAITNLGSNSVWLAGTHTKQCSKIDMGQSLSFLSE